MKASRRRNLGNPWDSGDQIVIDGSNGADTDGRQSGRSAAARLDCTGTQNVKYDSRPGSSATATST